MLLENRFIFVAKVFLIIFLIVNSVNFFPINLFNVFYYTNIFNVLLDTTTLLLLGLAIPRFLILKRIESLRKIEMVKPEEKISINTEIDRFEKKDAFNYKLIKFCMWFFIVICVAQPITLLFVLNRNDIYVNQTIDTITRALDIKKKEILDLPESRLPTELNENLKDKDKQKKEIIRNLDMNYDFTIENLIKQNNFRKFNQIKFICRNILMSLIWAFGFLKLSKIHFQE